MTGRSTIERELLGLRQLARNNLGRAITEHELVEWGDWCVKTCLLFGTTPETAYVVAAEFVKALRKECV